MSVIYWYDPLCCVWRISVYECWQRTLICDMYQWLVPGTVDPMEDD
jgi:hypothetical protein